MLNLVWTAPFSKSTHKFQLLHMFILASQGLTTKMQLLSTPFTWVVSRRLRDGFNHGGKRPSEVNKRTTNVTYPPSISLKNRFKSIFITINIRWCFGEGILWTSNDVWEDSLSLPLGEIFHQLISLDFFWRRHSANLKKSTHSPKSRFHQIIWWGFPVKRHVVFAFFPGKISRWFV